METDFSLSTHRKKRKGGLLGLLLVLVGILFLSFNFGWIDPRLRVVFFSWPMLIIAVSVVSFRKGDLFSGMIALIVGVFFLLPRIAIVYPGWMIGVDANFSHIYWPVLLIILGLLIIFRMGSGKRGKRYRNRNMTSETMEDVDGRIDMSVLFSGTESVFLSPVFTGGTITATFGGVVLDLRKTALPEGETYLDIDATFGGVELSIPDDWWIETRFHSVFGGVEDKRHVLQPDHTRKLILQGNLTFGGCEIR